MFDPTINGFCRRHKLCRQTAYNEINAGRLRTYKIGKSRRITEDADRDWLKDREQDAAA